MHIEPPQDLRKVRKEWKLQVAIWALEAAGYAVVPRMMPTYNPNRKQVPVWVILKK